MPVVGEGSFGCVHKPSLECKEPNIDYTNMVSKIMTRDSAKDELKEFKLLDKIDKEHKHFLGTPIKCNVKNSVENRNEIAKCRDSDKYDPTTHSNRVKLLIMEDGGINGEDYLYKIRELTNTTSVQKDKTELFYMHFFNILKSVEFFVKNKVAHRDIKLQNIVYNDKTENMKLIDFGLLTSYTNAKKEAADNKYWLNYFFWSIPPFAVLANKNKYHKIKKFLGNSIDADYSRRCSAITNDLIESLDINKSMNTHFYGTLVRRNNFKIPELKKRFHKSFKTMISKIHLYSHREYLKKMFNMHDVYNLGHTLIHSITIMEPHFHIKKTYNLNIGFINKIVELGLNMLSFDVFDHISINEVIDQYKTILLEHIDINRHNYNFKNESLVPTVNESIVPTVNESNKELGVSIITPFTFIPTDKKCVTEKELNPTTNRCVNKCKSGLVRNDIFLCVKNKTMKKICPTRKILNPNTDRCVKQCNAGFVRNDKFICVKNKTMKKICPNGKIINPNTDRCVKQCKAGFVRNDTFICVKNKIIK